MLHDPSIKPTSLTYTSEAVALVTICTAAREAAWGVVTGGLWVTGM